MEDVMGRGQNMPIIAIYEGALPLGCSVYRFRSFFESIFLSVLLSKKHGFDVIYAIVYLSVFVKHKRFFEFLM